MIFFATNCTNFHKFNSWHLCNSWQKKSRQIFNLSLKINNMKKLFLLIFLFGITSMGFSQLKSIPFEKIENLQQIQPRKVIVFIHTDWCMYCKQMKNSTFKNKDIIQKLNSDFYFIHFNAEEKRDISFNNRVFKYQPSGNNVGVHELAIQLGTINNQIVYPVLCVLNEKNEIIFQYNNYLNPKDFKLLLEKLKE